MLDKLLGLFAKLGSVDLAHLFFLLGQVQGAAQAGSQQPINLDREGARWKEGVGRERVGEKEAVEDGKDRTRGEGKEGGGRKGWIQKRIGQ